MGAIEVTSNNEQSSRGVRTRILHNWGLSYMYEGWDIAFDLRINPVGTNDKVE